MGQAQHAGGVERDQLRQVIDVLGHEAAANVAAGVVHQNADGGIVAQFGINRLQAGIAGQVGGQKLHRNAGLRLEFSGIRLQLFNRTRHQHEIVPALCEPLGIGSADPGRCAGDQDFGLGGHGYLLSWLDDHNHYDHNLKFQMMIDIIDVKNRPR